MSKPFKLCCQQYKFILNVHIRIILLTIMIIVNHKFNLYVIYNFFITQEQSINIKILWLLF